MIHILCFSVLLFSELPQFCKTGVCGGNNKSQVTPYRLLKSSIVCVSSISERNIYVFFCQIKIYDNRTRFCILNVIMLPVRASARNPIQYSTRKVQWHLVMRVRVYVCLIVTMTIPFTVIASCQSSTLWMPSIINCYCLLSAATDFIIRWLLANYRHCLLYITNSLTVMSRRLRHCSCLPADIKFSCLNTRTCARALKYIHSALQYAL